MFAFLLYSNLETSGPWINNLWGFPDSSDSKESTCNARDLGSIPGLKRSPGEGKGYPLQYSGLENSMDYIYSPLGCRVEHNSVTFTFGGSHISALED